MKPTQILVTIVLVLLVGGASFYAGMKYQSSGNRTFGAGQFFVQNGVGGVRMGMNGINRAGSAGAFRPVTGEITDADDKSITVKLQDGGSRIVFLAGNTAINKASEATKDDLTIGQTVAVFGQQNADGSVTAQTIQLNPLNPVTRGGTSTGSAQTK